MQFQFREMMDGLDKPPSSNTGALNTYPNGLRSLVDWFQGTFKFPQLCDFGYREIIELMGLNVGDFMDTDTGYKQWRRGLRLGAIQVYYDNPKEPSVHVILTGQGCRQFEVLSSVGWVNFFRSLLCRHFSATRLDLAIDDFGHLNPRWPDRGLVPYFSVQTLITRIEQGLCRSKFEWGRTMGRIRLDDGTYHGRSVYFGSPHSRIQIRVYEKDWERKNKGFDLEDGVEVWNRIEVQMRKERAQEAMRLIASGEKEVGEIVSGILRHYVNFVDRVPGDKNKSRWPLSRFWREFLGDVEPLRLTSVAPDRTLDRVERWLDRQVEPSLALLWLAYDGELDWLIEMLEDGVDRLKEKDFELLERTKDDFRMMVLARRKVDLDKKRGKRLAELRKKDELDEYKLTMRSIRESDKRISLGKEIKMPYPVARMEGTN